MKRVALLVVAVVVAAGFLISMSPVSGHPDGRADKQVIEQASPIFGVKIPAGYRDWKVIAVDNLLVPGKFDQLRVQLGNDIAIKAFREGTLPFPDGAIIAAIHWKSVFRR